MEPIQIWAQKELVKVRNSAFKMINPSVYFFCKNKDLYQSITFVSPYLPYIFVLLMQLPGVLALEVTDAWSFQGNVGAHVFYII